MAEASNNPNLTHEQWQAEQRQLLHWARSHVVPWGELEKNDYDFGSWAKDASDELLSAGCLYEHGRESRMFKCWLVWRTKPKPKELCGKLPVIEFKGSSATFDYLTQSGWARLIDDFADDLISNKSFADVLCTKAARVQASLNSLPSYSLIPKAVEMARTDTNYPGLEVLPVQICWPYYTDAEIGEEMKRLAKTRRPPKWKAPQRRGTGKATSTVALLDGLSAMRLVSHYPKTLKTRIHNKAGIHAGGTGTASDILDSVRRAGATTTAIDIFDSVRLGKIDGTLIYSDLDAYAGRARKQLSRWFPFHEAPANGPTWAMRRRLKSSPRKSD
jgi:hypothetical protein